MPNERPIKLTIAVPTYNRAGCLAEVLVDLAEIPVFDSSCEILVIDNASDDSTPDVTARYAGMSRFRIERNAFNIGLEGNIIKAMCAARGEFVWLLSDHMRVNPWGVQRLLDRLAECDGVVLGYVGIRDYGTVIGGEEPRALSSLTAAQRARLIFATSNISGLLVRTALVRRSIRSIQRMAGYSYPHLGVYFHLRDADCVVEFAACSTFQEVDRKTYRASYDTFRSRFIEYPELVTALGRANPVLKVGRHNTEIRAFTSALHFELLKLFLAAENSFHWVDLGRCWSVYSGRYRLLFVLLWIGGAFPGAWRRAAALGFLRRFIPGKYRQMESLLQMSSGPEQ